MIGHYSHAPNGTTSIAKAWMSLACAACCALCVVQATATQRPVEQVAAYGRVSPGERAVTLAAPYYLNSPPVVAELFVKEGDLVTRHQKLAVMQSQALASADLAMAKSHLSTAEERLRAKVIMRAHAVLMGHIVHVWNCGIALETRAFL